MLSVSVLGELALELDGVSVEPPVGRRARALLGLLVVDRRVHARSALAARFWPDVLDESARTSLRSALSALRRSLEPGADDWLVTTRDRVGLGDGVWSDVDAFEQHASAGRLHEALALYRGDLLAGLDEDWVLSARDDWRGRAAAVLERLAADAQAAGDWAGAIAHTRQIVALDPLAEEGQRALIRRLADAGDRPAALGAYSRYAGRLRTELRIAPSPATRALVDELRQAEPGPSGSGAGAVVPQAPARAAPPASQAGTVTLLFTDLVGSTELLGELGDDEAERLRRVHFGLLRDVALSHGGQEVKSLGDGLMVAFGSSVDAAGCAVGIQQAVDRHNRRTGSDRLRVRVGLNVGEPIRDEDDYFGTPVVIAKRLCDRADGGQILASELVRLLIGTRGAFAFRPVGELQLKGLAQPVAACEIGWEPAGGGSIALPSALGREQEELVGRARELAVLEDAWRLARTAGRLGAVVVAGEPGIGKTRLIAELCRRAQAEDGATVLLGRSHEETLTPYEPFVEALRQYVGACPIDELRLQVGTRRRILAKLVPDLGDADDGGRTADSDPAATGTGERFALFDAVGTLLVEVASTRPTILVLDDLHWADDASLLLLRHVARAAADAALLIVGTYRDTEVHADDPLSAALAELRRARTLESLALRGLDADGVALLIRGRGADLPQALGRAVAERTEGNPFFVEELVRHLETGEEGGLPESINDLLLRRLRRLSEPARRVLAAAAVLGREFDLDALGHMTGAGSEELLEAIDAALSEHVLAAVPDTVGRFAFAHALIRDTVYDQLSAARRPGLHRSAGEALEHLYATRLDACADQLAHHYAQAGDDAKSLDHQLRAARVAWDVFALEATIVHQSAALETAARLGLAPQADERVRRVLLQRGWMREVQGDHEAGVADYGRALDAARAAGDRRLQAEALDSLAFAEKSYDVARSGQHHQEALLISGEVGDLPLQVRILSRMSLARSNDLDLAGALEAGEQALALAERAGDGREIAIDALKLAALQLGDLDRLEVLTTELATSQRRRGDLWYLQWTLLESAFVPLGGARWDLATARLHEALAIHERIGDAFCGPMINDALCWLERSRGDLGAALAKGRRAVHLTERAGPTPWGAWTRATLGWALLDLRAGAAAVGVLERGLADARTLSDRFRTAGHLAWAHALAGDSARADDAARQAEDAFAQVRAGASGPFLFGFGAAASLARAQLAAGRPDDGAAALVPLLAAAERAGWHEATAALSLVVGLCDEARSHKDAATARLRSAIDLAAHHGLPAVVWEARAALARLSPAAEAEQLRAQSAAVVQRLAASVGDAPLAAAFVRAAER